MTVAIQLLIPIGTSPTEIWYDKMSGTMSPLPQERELGLTRCLTCRNYVRATAGHDHPHANDAGELIQRAHAVPDARERSACVRDACEPLPGAYAIVRCEAG